jgi:hypothetical protein
MARAKQLPRVHRYSLELKLSAVRLSRLPGVQLKCPKSGSIASSRSNALPLARRAAIRKRFASP